MINLSKRVLRQALDLSPVATLIVDLKKKPHHVVYVNQAFEALSGYDAGEMINHSWDELSTSAPPSDNKNDQFAYIQCHPRLGVAESICLDMLPIYHQPGAPRYWIGTERKLSPEEIDQQDVERDALLSVLRDARMHLRRLDGRDSATGILNRRVFDDLIERDWVMARREGRQLTTIIFRVDDFEVYREVFGRHAADSCLAKVAHAITGTLRRAGDLVARYSDDRFVVLMNDNDEQTATKLAENIVAKVAKLAIHHPRSNAGRFLNISYGVAVAVPSASLSADKLIEQADAGIDISPLEKNGLFVIKG
ncbi:MAG: sensor domain-containing diguanylate cyclase [Gammaproteobacteria bacterium]